MTAENEFEKMVLYLTNTHSAKAGKMFGAKCIKINSKVAVALHENCLVFKLPEGSDLWDPSNKNRPMKEWVKVLPIHKYHFIRYSEASANYVS